ncbi:fructosamine kinase family protein [Pelagibius sp.]|uniref:fructosamine kinase family protein n=1 Tax=Pelagibius sp. TaxID=1931238 RepID=UPI003BB182BA
MDPITSGGRLPLQQLLADTLGQRPEAVTPLLGGCVAEVFRVDLAGAEPLVAKVAPEGGLAIEGFMLDFLAARTSLPVPPTRHVADQLLLMDYMDHEAGAGDTAAQEDAAERLAALHAITAPAYGFERDTVIGALPQPNPWTENWCDFYREQRLLVMGRIARESGRLPVEIHRELEAFCTRLERFIEQPPQPGLVHGDVWSGNVLLRRSSVAAFIDPALYFADPEVEIAYIELLSTFGPAFHRHYQALRPPRPGYREARRDIYNLFPLLVHTQICGPPYAQMVRDILTRYA